MARKAVSEPETDVRTDGVADEALPAPEQPKKFYSFPAVIPDDDGYYSGARWLRIVCDWPVLLPREGTAPLWAEIDASLTINEAGRIPNPFEANYADLVAHVAPRVRAWNARMVDAESGALVPAPMPSEKGLEAFGDVNPYILVWLGYVLKTLHMQGGPNRKNATSGSGDTSDGPSDDA